MRTQISPLVFLLSCAVLCSGSPLRRLQNRDAEDRRPKKYSVINVDGGTSTAVTVTTVQKTVTLVETSTTTKSRKFAITDVQQPTADTVYHTVTVTPTVPAFSSSSSSSVHLATAPAETPSSVSSTLIPSSTSSFTTSSSSSTSLSAASSSSSTISTTSPSPSLAPSVLSRSSTTASLTWLTTATLTAITSTTITSTAIISTTVLITPSPPTGPTHSSLSPLTDLPMPTSTSTASYDDGFWHTYYPIRTLSTGVKDSITASTSTTVGPATSSTFPILTSINWNATRPNTKRLE